MFKVGDKFRVVRSIYNFPGFTKRVGIVDTVTKVIGYRDRTEIYGTNFTGPNLWFESEIEKLELVPFSPADLTTGMVVEYMDGSKGLILKNTDIEYQENIALTFYPHKGSYSNLDDDFLTYDEYGDFTVKRIIKPYDVSEIFNFPESIDGEVIWERPNSEKEKLNQQISKLEQELKEAKERLESM